MPEFPRQFRRILPRQFIQSRNLQGFERPGVLDPHPLALTQRDDLPHPRKERRIYFRRPLFQSEKFIPLRGIFFPQSVYSGFAEFPPSLKRFRREIERAPAGYDYSQHLSTQAGHQGAVGDQLARTLAVAGTAEECSRRVAELMATGIDGCIFPLLGGGRAERLRVLKEVVAQAVS